MCLVRMTHAIRKHVRIPAQVEKVCTAQRLNRNWDWIGGRDLKADGERGKRFPRETSRKSGCLLTD